jgi:carboxymethylenebutenolidase
MEPRRRKPAMREQDTTLPGHDRQLECYLALPDGEGAPAPAVVVIHEIFGPDAHIRDVARRFAALGYVAAAPNLFTGEVQRVLTPENIALAMQALAQAPQDLRRKPSGIEEFAASQPAERRPVLAALGRVSKPEVQADFARDLVALSRSLPKVAPVDPQRIGAVGFCFGGAVSGRLATVDPELSAAVIFYGQNPPLADLPKVRARVLGLYGGEDPGITATVPELEAAMRAAGKSFAYHVYPGAKHAFFNDTRPNYHPTSARDAWDRVRGFLAGAWDEGDARRRG